MDSGLCTTPCITRNHDRLVQKPASHRDKLGGVAGLRTRRRMSNRLVSPSPKSLAEDWPESERGHLILDLWVESVQHRVRLSRPESLSLVVALPNHCLNLIPKTPQSLVRHSVIPRVVLRPSVAQFPTTLQCHWRQMMIRGQLRSPIQAIGQWQFSMSLMTPPRNLLTHQTSHQSGYCSTRSPCFPPLQTYDLGH